MTVRIAQRRSGLNARPLLALLLSIAVMPAAAPAQEAPAASDGQKAEALISRQREAYLPRTRKRCGEPSASGEIVVCATDSSQYRTDSSTAADPNSRNALKTGVPRAPELGRGSCRGKFGCLLGGGAPAPLYIFDLSTIPETPKGSDAEKVANGEMSDR